MSIVIKFSKPTKDVLTASNSDLAFSSELATHSFFNIYNLAITSGQSSGTINHNLGFVPKVWIFRKDSDGDGDFLRRIPYFEDIASNEFDYYITSSSVVVTRYYTTTTDNFLVIIFTRSPNP